MIYYAAIYREVFMRHIVSIFFLLMFFVSAYAASETTIMLDVARRNNSVSLSFTEYCDHAVRATVRSGGDDYAMAGYDVNLVFGGTSSGCIFEGVITNVNEVVFNCEAASIPTNGKYSVQIMAMKDRKSEEWGRGTLRVNVNPGMSYMPSCWMGYEKIARLSASLISADLMTNVIFQSVFARLESQYSYVDTATNQCVIVKNSFVDEISAPNYFIWDRSNIVDRIYRNYALPNSYISMNSNGNFMTSTFYLAITNTIETFNPCRINGDVWYRSASVTNRTFKVKGSYCSDSIFNAYLYGE